MTPRPHSTAAPPPAAAATSKNNSRRSSSSTNKKRSTATAASTKAKETTTAVAAPCASAPEVRETASVPPTSAAAAASEAADTTSVFPPPPAVLETTTFKQRETGVDGGGNHDEEDVASSQQQQLVSAPPQQRQQRQRQADDSFPRVAPPCAEAETSSNATTPVSPTTAFINTSANTNYYRLCRPVALRLSHDTARIDSLRKLYETYSERISAVLRWSYYLVCQRGAEPLQPPPHYLDYVRTIPFTDFSVTARRCATRDTDRMVQLLFVRLVEPVLQDLSALCLNTPRAQDVVHELSIEDDAEEKEEGSAEVAKNAEAAASTSKPTAKAAKDSEEDTSAAIAAIVASPAESDTQCDPLAWRQTKWKELRRRVDAIVSTLQVQSEASNSEGAAAAPSQHQLQQQKEETLRTARQAATRLLMRALRVTIGSASWHQLLHNVLFQHVNNQLEWDVVLRYGLILQLKVTEYYDGTLPKDVATSDSANASASVAEDGYFGLSEDACMALDTAISDVISKRHHLEEKSVVQRRAVAARRVMEALETRQRERASEQSSRRQSLSASAETAADGGDRRPSSTSPRVASRRATRVFSEGDENNGNNAVPAATAGTGDVNTTTTTPGCDVDAAAVVKGEGLVRVVSVQSVETAVNGSTTTTAAAAGSLPTVGPATDVSLLSLSAQAALNGGSFSTLFAMEAAALESLVQDSHVPLNGPQDSVMQHNRVGSCNLPIGKPTTAAPATTTTKTTNAIASSTPGANTLATATVSSSETTAAAKKAAATASGLAPEEQTFVNLQQESEEEQMVVLRCLHHQASALLTLLLLDCAGSVIAAHNAGWDGCSAWPVSGQAVGGIAVAAGDGGDAHQTGERTAAVAAAPAASHTTKSGRSPSPAGNNEGEGTGSNPLKGASTRGGSASQDGKAPLTDTTNTPAKTGTGRGEPVGKETTSKGSAPTATTTTGATLKGGAASTKKTQQSRGGGGGGTGSASSKQQEKETNTCACVVM